MYYLKAGNFETIQLTQQNPAGRLSYDYVHFGPEGASRRHVMRVKFTVEGGPVRWRNDSLPSMPMENPHNGGILVRNLEFLVLSGFKSIHYLRFAIANPYAAVSIHVQYYYVWANEEK